MESVKSTQNESNSCPFVSSGAIPETITEDLRQSAIYQELRSFLSQPSYPCIAAVKAAAKGDIRLRVYPSIEASAANESLAIDLHRFVLEQQRTGSIYLTFVAVFEAPLTMDDSGFESALWAQLQNLHEHSKKHFTWDENAVSDPKDPKFCFSFAGEAMFVVGLHGRSARLSRRFKYPTLVFNLFRQFEALKNLHQYVPMQDVNRRRDLVFQGSINPMLTRFGDDAEAIQYSGRDHRTFWTCPFHHDNKDESDHGTN